MNFGLWTVVDFTYSAVVAKYEEHRNIINSYYM